MDAAEAPDLLAALQQRLSAQFGQALVVVRWALVADCMNGDDERGVVAISDEHAIAYEAKALIREALSRKLFDDDDTDDE